MTVCRLLGLVALPATLIAQTADPPKSVKFNELEGVLCDVKMVGW
jgi:hypothetical protein